MKDSIPARHIVVSIEIRIAYRHRENISETPKRDVHLTRAREERPLRKHFRPFRTRLSALRPRRTRALDGCIDHPKCKLPTQKYNSHVVGTRPARRNMIFPNAT